jgi:ankyrin repeat protein
MKHALLVIALLISPCHWVVGADTGGMALISAAMSGEVTRVNDLLAQGVDPNTVNAAGRAALHFAAFNGNLLTAQALLAAGADPGLADGRGITPLMEASAFGHLEIVRLLILRGVDVNAADQAGNTALGLAKKGQYGKVSELLGEVGATESAPKNGKQ